MTAKLIQGYEVVIGFETHTQLSTQSKIFSRSPTAFGAEPYTQASPVDLALPGTLPVMNKGAVGDSSEAMVKRIRQHTTMPIALGFGISRPEHVAEVGLYADAAVVGSALVSLIAEAGGSPRLLEQVERYIRDLKSACVASRT